jgi:hypothetical protein
MNVRSRIASAAVAAMSLGFTPWAAAQSYEVWLVDQSNTTGLTFGGAIHVFDGSVLMGGNASNASPTDVIDLSEDTAAMCMAMTGANPVRPHMLFFDSSHSRAVLSFVASGHVVVFDAASRMPITCLRTSEGAGGARQAHAAIPAPDDSFLLVANQNGKLLQRILTDVDGDGIPFEDAADVVMDPAATLDLANCTTPNGVPCQSPGVRPDNAPICPIVDASSTLGFVTLRGGGLFVVDATSTPMTILGEYDAAAVHGNGCGGAQVGDDVFLNSGGGTATNLSEFDVYRFPTSGYGPLNPVNTPAPVVVFSDDDPMVHRDSHGILATKKGRFLWVGDRFRNLFEVIEVATSERVNTVDLVGPLSDDPTPDLVDLSPGGHHLFVALRGPNPLSGDPHVSTGSTPGLGVIKITQGGRDGKLRSVVRISNMDAMGVERADPHAVRVRRK